MPHARAMRPLNVNSTSVQKPVEMPGNDKLQLERSSLMLENQPVNELSDVQSATEKTPSSSIYQPMNSNENPECSSSSGQVSNDSNFDNNFLPIVWNHVESASHRIESGTASTSSFENTIKQPLVSTSKFVTELHAKLCPKNISKKKCHSKKSNKKAKVDSKALNTNVLTVAPDNPNGNDIEIAAGVFMPLPNTIVDDILSLELDFPMPSTSFGEPSASATNHGGGKRLHESTATTQSKEQKKVRKDRENVDSMQLLDTTTDISSSDSVSISIIDEDSDCEITGVINRNSKKKLECDACTQTNCGITQMCLKPLSEQVNATSMRISSLINLVTQRADTIVLDITENDSPLRSSRGNQTIPPIIIVSDDEDGSSETSALKKRVKNPLFKLDTKSVIKLSKKKRSRSKGKLWECPICYEEMNSDRGISATVCGHTFCKPCIGKVLKSSKKCPKCRATLNRAKVHPLYVEGR